MHPLFNRKNKGSFSWLDQNSFIEIFQFKILTKLIGNIVTAHH